MKTHHKDAEFILKWQKKNGDFFCLLYNRKLFINTSTIICFNEVDNEDTPACE